MPSGAAQGDAGGKACREPPDHPDVEVGIGRGEGIALLRRIWNRRSTPPRHLTAPGPTDDKIRMLVRAASRAPDHLHLKPFRFLVIAPDMPQSLADVFEAAERELDPAMTGEKLERA